MRAWPAHRQRQQALQARRGMPLALCAAALLLLLAACGGSSGPKGIHPDTALYSSIEPDRVMLMEVFRSYDNEETLRSQLTSLGVSPERRALKKTPSGRYPPRDLTSLHVKNFRNQGELGSLTLELFNNRLMEADFRPEDPSAYAKTLHRTQPGLKRDATGIAELVAGNLRIFSNVDFAKSRVGGSLGTDALVLWQDRRLTAQRDDWDDRFGSIPEPAK